jgi:hypothetical protein
MLLAKEANRIATYANTIAIDIQDVENKIYGNSHRGYTMCTLVVRRNLHVIQQTLLEAGYTLTVIRKLTRATTLKVEW